MSAVTTARRPDPPPRVTPERPMPGPTLGGYARFVRRHRAVIAAMAILGAAVGAALTLYWPAVYTAEATVAVAAAPAGVEAEPDQPRFVSLDSEAQIMTSGEVLAGAAEASSFPGGVAALTEHLRVSALPNTRVLVVTVTSPDRAVALRACTAMVDEFLRIRAAAAQARGDLAIAELEAQAAVVQAQLTALGASAGEAVAGEEPPALLVAEQQLLGRLTELSAELRVAALAATTSPGQVVDAAAAPAQGSRPLAAGTVVAGLLIGLAAGVAVAGWTTAGRDGPRPRARSAPAGRS